MPPSQVKKKPKKVKQTENIESFEEEKEHSFPDDNSDSDSDSSSLPGSTTQRAKKKSKGGFHAMKLSDSVMQGIHFMGFKQPTPIQRKAIPPALLGRDLMCMARTGSGKTAAFLIPLIERLIGNDVTRHASSSFRAVVLSPTRELAIQTFKICKSLSKRTSLKLCLLHGGDSREAQFDALANNPDVLICTPGRLADLLNETRDFSLSNLQVLVVDEADRVFEMNFSAQLHEILSRTPSDKQTLLFSATLPQEVAEFARAKLNNVELIRLDTDMRISDTLKLEFFKVRNAEERVAALLYILKHVVNCRLESTLVFCATKQQVEFLAELLRKVEGGLTLNKDGDLGIGMAHGSMDQEAREEALAQFRSGKVKLLLTTDLAARGLDIPLVNHVINFDFCDKAKLFVHRVGRAARQGRSGSAFSLVSTEELAHFVDVTLYLARPEMEIGTFPQDILDEGTEWTHIQLNNYSELTSMLKQSDNAHKMFLKTRAEPSRRSIKRSKEIFNQIGPHSRFEAGLGDKNDTAEGHHVIRRADLLAFRPKKTTFETEVAKRKQQKDNQKEAAEKAVAFSNKIKENKREFSERKTATTTSKPRVSTAAAKRMKKEQSSLRNSSTKEDIKPVIPTVAAPAPGAPTGQFRDPVYFLSNESSSSAGQHVDHDFESQLKVHQLKDAVLELNPDDSEGLAKKSRSFQWDKRKKKFIQSSLQDHVAAKRLKTANGSESFNSENAGEAYDRWAKKTRRRIGSVQGGNEESNGGETDVRKLSLIRRDAKRRNSSYLAPGRRIQDEVHNEEQLVSKHREKAKKLDKLKGRKNAEPRKKAGADAKVNRVGKTLTKPKQWSRSYVKRG